MKGWPGVVALVASCGGRPPATPLARRANGPEILLAIPSNGGAARGGRPGGPQISFWRLDHRGPHAIASYPSSLRHGGWLDPHALVDADTDLVAYPDGARR